MKAFVLALALVAGGPVVAQSAPPASVLPLEVGNRWEYQVLYPTSGTIVWEVVGDTPVGGERIFLMRFDGGATCGIRTALTQNVRSFRLVDVDDTSATCAQAPSTFPGYHEFYDRSAIVIVGAPQVETVEIGNATVTGTLWPSPPITGGVGIHYQEGYGALEGVGMTGLWRTVGGTGNPQTQVLRYTLAYARVGGVEYGQRVTAAEETPGTAAALTVGPNPARTVATLRFAASDRPSDARISDALGRVVRRVEVPAGTTEVRLDVLGFAPGVYVASVGAASVRLVVAR